MFEHHIALLSSFDGHSVSAPFQQGQIKTDNKHKADLPELRFDLYRPPFLEGTDEDCYALIGGGF